MLKKIDNYQLPTNKNFGYFFSLIFFIFAIYFFFTDKKIISSIFISLFIIIFLISFIKPSLLFFFNKMWMYFGYFLGIVFSSIILSFIFFLLFTPISLIMKIFKRDELRIRKEVCLTYWRIRSPAGPERSSLKNQF